MNTPRKAEIFICKSTAGVEIVVKTQVMLSDGLDERSCEMHIPPPPPPPPSPPVYIMLHAVVSWAFYSSSPPAHLRSPSPPEKLKWLVSSQELAAGHNNSIFEQHSDCTYLKT